MRNETIVACGVLALAITALSCNGDTGVSPEPTTSATTASSDDATSEPATGPMGDTSAAATSSDDGADSSEGAMDDSGTADTAGTTGTEVHPCGLDDLEPGAADPIEFGRGAMQIPPDIAAIQLASCGCHLTDDVEATVPDYPASGGFDMTSWDGFHALRPGDDMPYHAVARAHVDSTFMPLGSYCNDGRGNAMDPASRATLLLWLTAGAPDGATWVPR